MRRVTDLPMLRMRASSGSWTALSSMNSTSCPNATDSSPACAAGWDLSRPASSTTARTGPPAQPKQTLRKLIKYAMDGMISFSYKPLRAATYMGFCVSAASFLLVLFYFATFFIFHKWHEARGFTTLIIAVLFLGGVQLITVGILGEYIGRIYEEIKQRPLYVVQERLGLSARCARPRTGWSIRR